MPRKLRLEFPDACYDVINRGNYRRALCAPKGAAESFEGANGVSFCDFDVVASGSLGLISNCRSAPPGHTAASAGFRDWSRGPW